MGGALGKGGPVDAVSLLERVVTESHMGASVSSVVCAGVVHVFSGCGGVGLLGGIWLAALVGVPGDLSRWMVGRKILTSYLLPG